MSPVPGLSSLSSISPQPDPTISVLDWTVIAYIVADHSLAAPDLDIAAKAEADAIRLALRDANAHVAVQIDLQGDTGGRRWIGDEPMKELPESRGGDPEVLNDFLQAVAVRCPSKHRLAMFWGHGGGPLGFFHDELPWTSPAPATLSLPVVRECLAQFGGVDLLVAKSCSMATLEAAYELRHVAKYLIASQGNVSEHPWEYQQIATALRQVRGLDAGQLACDFVEALQQHYRRTARTDDDAVPYSALSLDAVTLERMHVNISALARKIQAGRIDPRFAAAVAQAIDDARPDLPPWEPSLLDIVTLCEHLELLPALEDEAAAVIRDVPALVRHVAPKDTLFRGVSIFHYPKARERSFANGVGPEEYGELQFVRTVPDWSSIAFENAPWASL
jgi:hypothetical protein